MTDRRNRSESNDFEESDFESQAGDAPAGKPGRKKNPNSQAARRDQNRIAQREFRLRKQQRIRDLEARVEILSGTKDEAVGEMRNLLKDLMAENQTLRNLLRSLASFIGDGAGGLLPKMGWNIQDFNEFVNRGETDTAWESFQRRKSTTQNGGDDSSRPSGHGQKRTADGESNGSSSKKARRGDKDTESTFSMMMPMSSSSLGPSTRLYPGVGQPPEHNGIFPDLMRGASNDQLFMHPSANESGQFASSPSEGYSRTYMPSVNAMEQPTTTLYESPRSAPATQQRSNDAAEQELEEEEEDPKKNEAMKLIHYHLENYKRNSSYCLPASLRPTPIQRTIPHESVIDRVLHPELRDRMILLRQRYELVDCLLDMRKGTIIHGDDVLAHTNWELGEDFVRKYSFLVDPPLLKIVNRWRRERGDPEITLPETSSAIEHI